MNDYRRIRRRSSGHHKYVRPDDLLALHQASPSWIDATFGKRGPANDDWLRGGLGSRALANADRQRLGAHPSNQRRALRCRLT